MKSWMYLRNNMVKIDIDDVTLAPMKFDIIELEYLGRKRFGIEN
jgi:hypothetical protein